MCIIKICIHKHLHQYTMMMIKGLEQLIYRERMRKLGCSSWRKKISGDCMNVYTYLKGGYKEDRARLFLVMSTKVSLTNKIYFLKILSAFTSVRPSCLCWGAELDQLLVSVMGLTGPFQLL